MYIHALHCSWLENPFWRKSFLLDDADDRDRVRQSVPSLTIDLTKGRGLALEPAAPRGPVPATEAPEELPTAVTPKPVRRRPGSSLDRARDSVERATNVVVDLFNEARLGRAIHVDALAPTVDALAEAMARDAAAVVTVSRLKATDRYTYIHSVAVAALMMGLARQLDFSEADVRVAGTAGLLHDIGKIAIPPTIVAKPGALTASELATMRTHPVHGHASLQSMAGVDPRILEVCRHHHEKMDGTGYPDRLSADALTPFVRMAAVCDVYDALTSIRSYKPAWSPHHALAQMQSWSGHFDPPTLRAFIASLGIPPLGALVRLRSNRLAIVVGDGDTPQAPRVRAFFDIPDHRDIAPIDVPCVDDPIIRTERGDYWFGDRWDAIRTTVAPDAASPIFTVRQEAYP